MKRFSGMFLICFAVSVLFIGYGLSGNNQASAASDKPSAEKISVYASFYPMYDFAVKIGGDRVKVTNMVPAGVEPHDWEPAAADAVGLEKAAVFVYNGVGMEHWVEDILKSLQNKKLVVVEASQGIKLIEGGHRHEEGEEEEEEEEEEGAFDPHVWLSPVNAKKEMENIKNALVKADPEGRKVYEANYEKYAALCDSLDKEFKDAIAPLKKKEIVVAHQAFGYLCERYGLKQVPIEGLSPDSEPSPARMAEVIDFVKDHGVKVIFFEELASPKVAEAIAKATKAKTDMLNPLEGLGDDEMTSGEDYFSVMRENLKSLVAALN
jgi:zinc transport system substrate-binding protein